MRSVGTLVEVVDPDRHQDLGAVGIRVRIVHVLADERIREPVLAVDLDGLEVPRAGRRCHLGSPVGLVPGAAVDGHPEVARVRDRDGAVDLAVGVGRDGSLGVPRLRDAAGLGNDVESLIAVADASGDVGDELAVLFESALLVAELASARAAAAAGPGRTARASARAAAARRAACAVVDALGHLVDDLAALVGVALGRVARVDAVRLPVLVDRALVPHVAAVERLAGVGVAAGATAAARSARAGGRTTGAGCARHAGGRSLVAVLRPTDASDGGEGDEHERNEGDGEGELVHGNTRFLILGFGNVLIGDDACASDSDSPTSGYLT